MVMDQEQPITEICQGLPSERLIELLQGYIDPVRRENEMLKAILKTIKERL